jgi:curli biogenesis system outer membrane secretion channel CsgG
MRFPLLMLRLSLPCAALLLAACSTPGSVVATPGGPEAAQAVAPPLPEGSVPVVVALTAFDYKPVNGPVDARRGDIGRGLAELLAQSLVGSGRYSVQPPAAPGQPETAALAVRGHVIVFEPDCQAGAAIIVSSASACLSLDLKVTDAASGKALRIATVDGASSSNSAGLIYARGALPPALGAYAGTPMEPVIRNCIEAAVNGVIAAKP